MFAVAIIIIVAIVVAVYVVINNRNNSSGGKRSVAVRGITWGGEAPVAKVYAQSKIVIPGVDYDGSSDAPLAKFAGGAVRGLPAKAQRRYVVWTPDELVTSDDK